MTSDDYIDRRLHPSRRMPEYFTLRHLRAKITEIASILERSGWVPPIRVLDAGSGCAPYRKLFSEDGFQYVAADREAMAGVSLRADGRRLPFPDGVFDLVLSNQVIEHVADPAAVCAELKRLVSARGYLLLSSPFVWEVHNFPADYWRFSEQGLRLLFADMDLVYLEPSTSSAQCLAQTFNLFINRNAGNDFLKGMLFRLTNSRLVEAALPRKDLLIPANYVLLARRPVPSQGRQDLAASSQARGAGHNGTVTPRLGAAPASGEEEPVARNPENFRMHVDSPAAARPVRGQVLEVSGWIAGDAPLDSAWTCMDGAGRWPLECNLPRLDVWRSLPQFRCAHCSGFRGACRIERLQPGPHTLEIHAESGGVRLVWDPVGFTVS
ncbi:MAG: class I SAM-dependent methyltransferase [Acidobacteria bacterium]|nr:class I SAM-dependent methyltransferase [Acidobacteriota bacterium]